MTTALGTLTSGKLFVDYPEPVESEQSQKDMRVWQRALRMHAFRASRADRSNDDLRIQHYVPYLMAASGWLPVVEQRIRDSVVPDEYKVAGSSDWLTEEVADAALNFFRKSADLLPSEPHIYASNSGSLVAEFQTAKGNLTTVVSEGHTILFAVLKNAPNEPLQQIIRRGSNQFREELQEIAGKLTVGAHGKMDPAG